MSDAGTAPLGQSAWRGAHPRRRGGVLLLSLVGIATVTLMGSAYLRLSASTTARQIRATDNKRSFYLAEAGLAEAYAGILIGRTGTVGSSTAPARLGDGLFWVEVEDNGNGTKTIESTGMCGSGRAVLAVTVENGRNSVAALGVFTRQPLDIPSGSTIDAYDSSLGSYEDQVAPEEPAAGGGLVGGLVGAVGDVLVSTVDGTSRVLRGEELTAHNAALESPEIGSSAGARIGSNGPIVVREEVGTTTEIHGDVRPGPGEAVTEVGDPYIAGLTHSLHSSVELPPVDVPAVTFQAPVENTSGIPLVLASGDHAYELLRVGPDAQVELQGPMRLVVEDLQVEGRGELVLDTEQGRIDIYVADELLLERGSVLEVAGEDPRALSIQVAGTADTVLRATSRFFGMLYAPQSRTSVASSFEVFGSLVGDELEFLGSANLHFDRLLGDYAELLGVPQFLTWRIVEIADPVAAGGVARADPFAILGVNRATALLPAASHLDQLLEIDYRDLSGILQTYSGSEAAFDWTQVRQVLRLARDGTEPGAVDGLAGTGGVGGRGGISGLEGLLNRVVGIVLGA